MSMLRTPSHHPEPSVKETLVHKVSIDEWSGIAYKECLWRLWAENKRIED
jgi:hypothetical protein